jgi:type IV secretion system protein TrbE
LPNPAMEAEMFELYKKMGLNDRQIELIAHVGIPKRHYYVVTPEGNRLIDLGFSDYKPLAFAFIGLSKNKGNALVETCKEFGNQWVYHWLHKNGYESWGEYWKTHYAEEVMA